MVKIQRLFAKTNLKILVCEPEVWNLSLLWCENIIIAKTFFVQKIEQERISDKT